MKRKTPYSLVDVKNISVDSILAGRSGQACIVGVDVAKGELVACLYWPDRSFDRPWRIEIQKGTGFDSPSLRGIANEAAAPAVRALDFQGSAQASQNVHSDARTPRVHAHVASLRFRAAGCSLGVKLNRPTAAPFWDA